MAGKRAPQAEQSLIIALEALVVTLVVTLQGHRLLQRLDIALLVAGRQSEEVADEIGDLELLLAREGLGERDDVVEDGLADGTGLLLDHAEYVGYFLEQEGRAVALRVVVNLHDLLNQVQQFYLGKGTAQQAVERH
jgi:hypothetical protein